VKYESSAIAEVTRAANPLRQHALDTYASETNKVVSVWSQFADADLGFRPHERSMNVRETMRHQVLSERRFFAEFLGSPEPPVAELLPVEDSVAVHITRFVELVHPRLEWLAARETVWWLATSQFFDAPRERVWIFWRRVLDTAHHRTQLRVNLRLLGKPVVPTYGPTADMTWDGASPRLAPPRQ